MNSVKNLVTLFRSSNGPYLSLAVLKVRRGSMGSGGWIWNLEKCGEVRTPQAATTSVCDMHMLPLRVIQASHVHVLYRNDFNTSLFAQQDFRFRQLRPISTNFCTGYQDEVICRTSIFESHPIHTKRRPGKLRSLERKC
jgi:hypothetical protein